MFQNSCLMNVNVHRVVDSIEIQDCFGIALDTTKIDHLWNPNKTSQERRLFLNEHIKTLNFDSLTVKNMQL